MIRSIGAMIVVLAFATTALAGPAAVDGWNGGGLPPAIAKARPSAGVPADVPESGIDDCEILRNLTLYTPVGRHAIVGVNPSRVASPQQLGCQQGQPPEAGSPASRPGGPGE
jgi:hypothetical protein